MRDEAFPRETERRGAGSAAFSSERHPHEPEIPPAWNEDGRCLVCALGVLMDRLLSRIEELRAALEMVATCRREDGTYNVSREACEQLAHEALARDQDFTNPTVTKWARFPITEERPRDVGAPGAAT